MASPLAGISATTRPTTRSASSWGSGSDAATSGPAGAEAAGGEADADGDREQRHRVPAAAPAPQQPGQQWPAGGDQVTDSLDHAGEPGGDMGVGGAQRDQ